MGDNNHTTNVGAVSQEQWKAFLRYIILEKFFDEAILQQERIEIDKASSNLKVLFADIHFFLVAVSNILKSLQSLRSALKRDIGLQQICRKYLRQLEYLDSFRDHEEHISDGRLDGFGKKGQPLKNPSMLGNLFGDEYDFGGQRFNLVGSFSLIQDLHVELLEWNKTAKVSAI